MHAMRHTIFVALFFCFLNVFILFYVLRMNRPLSTLKYLIEQDSSFDILLGEANAKAKNKEEAQLLVTIKVLEQLGQSSRDMPIDLKKRVMELRGRDVKMVIEKKLTNEDLKTNSNRFLMPKNKVRAGFLSEEEENIVQKKEDGLRVQGMEVSLIEPSLNKSTIWLKKWKVGKDMSYVLSSQWISVATRNGLAVNDVIKLWSFRVDGSLYLALNKL